MTTPLLAELEAKCMAAWDAYDAARLTQPDEEPVGAVLYALDDAIDADIVWHEAIAAEDAAAHLRCPTAWARLLSDDDDP